MLSPIIYGCRGLTLSDKEHDFFKKFQPAGFILFERNCANPDQTKRLVKALSALYDEKVLILIDQEGGKVARLKPPHWEAFSPARSYGDLYLRDAESACRAVYESAQHMAIELNALGINVNCMPVLDIPTSDADPIIGSRAYGDDIASVVALGKQAASGLKSKAVLPVIKHLPGHGRAEVDSHHRLPIVDTELDQLIMSDFVPFKALADEPIGMTAHILFSALDDSLPVTLSKRIIGDVIRAMIRFDGLLLTDDIGMKALEGDLAKLSRDALAAGCDIVLHCSGKLHEMEEIAQTLPQMSMSAQKRLRATHALLADIART